MDEFGRNSLHNACIGLGFSRRETVDAVNAAILSGEDLNAADPKDWTALHFAAQNNDAEVCGLLLEAGAFVDPQDFYGNTPLWRAVINSKGDGECIKCFRSHGADPFIKNKSGISAVDLARGIGNYDVAQFFADI